MTCPSCAGPLVLAHVPWRIAARWHSWLYVLLFKEFDTETIDLFSERFDENARIVCRECFWLRAVALLGHCWR